MKKAEWVQSKITVGLANKEPVFEWKPTPVLRFVIRTVLTLWENPNKYNLVCGIIGKANDEKSVLIGSFSSMSDAQAFGEQLYNNMQG